MSDEDYSEYELKQMEEDRRRTAQEKAYRERAERGVREGLEGIRRGAGMVQSGCFGFILTAVLLAVLAVLIL